MRNITICSKIFKQDIIDFYYYDIKDCVSKYGERNEEIFFTFKREFLDIELLAQLMEDIILDGNSIVRESNKLYDIIKTLVFRNEHENIKKELYNYFKSANILNVEGYINFRLYKYSSKISEILYSVIKNNLYIE